MDKYQEFIMRNARVKYLPFGIQGENERKYGRKRVISVTPIQIMQDEDITITKYTCSIENASISAIYSVTNNECGVAWEQEEDAFFCVLDFDNRIDGIRISFADNIADDLFLNIAFEEADKEAYYAKKRAEKRAEYISKATISDAKGVNLVNIYFQPCDKSYEKTEVELYLYKNHQLLARYSVSGEQFYLAVPNLACNEYEYIVKQYDKKGELLFEAERVRFSI